MHVTGGGTLTVEHSVIEGSSDTVFTNGTVVRLARTRLVGGAALALGAGVLTCAGVYDEDLVFYAATCPGIDEGG
jgi:hypothetical protein